MNAEIQYKTVNGTIYPHIVSWPGHNNNLRYKIKVNEKKFPSASYSWYCYDLKLGLVSLKAYIRDSYPDQEFEYEVTHGRF